MSNRDGDGHVSFSFHISCVGVSVFTIKSVDGEITNTSLVPSFGS